ncbi:MAG: peptidylprolyl isomerase [Verrucomicrobiota bacterium]
MISLIHDKFKYILIAILIVLIAAFVTWDYNSANQGGGMPTHVGEIAHKKINRAQFASALIATQVLYNISPDSYAEHLQMMMRGGMFSNRDQIMERLTWDRLLVTQAAREAGIQVTSQEALEFVQSSATFQEDGKFSSAKFKQFDQNFLKPQGITDGRFEEIVKEQIMYNEITSMVKELAIAPSGEVQELLNDRYSPTTLSLVRLKKEDYSKDLQPSREELEEHYSQNASKYSTEEERVVQYVEFLLPLPVTLEDKEKKSAINNLGREAYDFAEQFVSNPGEPTPEISFEAAAEAAGLEILKSRPLKQGKSFYQGTSETSATQAVFQLNDAQPISEQIQVENGFVVLKLVDIKLAEPISYEKVAKKVEEDYLLQKTIEKTTEAGNELHAKIQDKLTNNISWDGIIEELKFEAETLEPIVPAEANNLKVEDANVIRAQVGQLEQGDLSPFLTTDNGGIILYALEKGEPSPDKVSSLKPIFEQQLKTQERSFYVQNWIRGLYENPGTVLPASLTQPGA